MLLYNVLAMLEWAAKDKSRSVLTLWLVLKLSSRGSDKSTTMCGLAWEISSFVSFSYEEFGVFIFSKCVNIELLGDYPVCMQSAHPPAFVQFLLSLTSLIHKTQRSDSCLFPRCKQMSLSNSVSSDWQLTHSVFLFNLQKILFPHCKLTRHNMLRQMLFSPRYPYNV